MTCGISFAAASRTLVVGCAALSVLVALVPLALVLFYVVSQGVHVAQLGVLHRDAAAGRRSRRRHGERDRRHADRRRPRRAVRDSDRRRQRHLRGRIRGHAARRRVRFAADTLNGVPSIVIGVFVYGIAVLPFRQLLSARGRPGARAS